MQNQNEQPEIDRPEELMGPEIDEQIEMVFCHSCSFSRPASDFHRSLLIRAKYVYHCKDCIRNKNKRVYKTKKEKAPKPPVTVGLKVCSKCEVEHPVANYQKHKLSKDGLQSICNACKKTSYEKTGKPRGRRPKKIEPIQLEMLA